MRKTIISLIFLSLFGSHANANEDYWSYEEYLEAYESQVLLTQSFSQQVRKDAHPSSIKDSVSVAIIYPGKQASDYWRRSVTSFEARLNEAKVDYQLHNYFSKPGIEINQQIQHIVSALELKPDYLIFTLDALKHQIIIERLVAQKKPKVILQNITTPLKRWKDKQPFLYVGFDHALGTKILVKRYLETFPKGAKFAIFYGPKGYVSEMRGGTFRQAFKDKSEFNLLAEYYTGFDRANAYKAAINLFDEHKDIDFIFSCSTDIALGVIDAIKATPGSNTITNGWGGGSAELEVIDKGELAFTVMRMNDDNGVAMAEAILNDISQKPSPTIYSGDIRLVDGSMDAQDINQLKKYAFRYSDYWRSRPKEVLPRE